jgi:hypothetical protein
MGHSAFEEEVSAAVVSGFGFISYLSFLKLAESNPACD